MATDYGVRGRVDAVCGMWEELHCSTMDKMCGYGHYAGIDGLRKDWFIFGKNALRSRMGVGGREMRWKGQNGKLCGLGHALLRLSS